LGDGISRNKVDQKEDERHDQPDDREGVEDALEEGFQQFSVLSFAIRDNGSALRPVGIPRLRSGLP
jgi:hypothetical protein